MAQVGDTDSQPLRGIVLCCTSLTQDIRIRIDQTARQLGAVHQLDLTSDVTHLLVGSIDTPKYRYVAKDRPDIHVLHPEFIEDVRKAWMEGIELDVADLERKHAVPPFLGLQVCLTGFEDMGQRKELENTLVKNGATYHGDLTKTVTHLIAAAPQGAKYKHAIQWKIHVISLKWYEDCITRGMALDESLYNPQLPEEQQGTGAFRTVRRSTSLSKRPRDSENRSASDDPSRRKLRKVASVRLDSQSQDMWRSISQADLQSENVERDCAPVEEVPTVRKEKSEESRPPTPGERQGLFSGHFILLHGFEAHRANKLRAVLPSNGATIVQNADELEAASTETGFEARCLLVPHDQSIELPDVPLDTLVLTEWWAERCLHYKKLLSLDVDPLSSPLSNALVRGFLDLSISTTGLSGVDLRQTAEAVKLMGATYQEKLLPSTSVLVCATQHVRKEKAFYAKKHNIPVVSARWLWDSLNLRKAASFDDYRINVNASESLREQLGASNAAPSPTPTLQLSEGDGNPVERVDEHAHRKRLSNTRKRHTTPSLKLKASSEEFKEPLGHRSRLSVLRDDESDQTSVPNHGAPADNASLRPPSQDRPLREISPNVSQPMIESGLEEAPTKVGGMFQAPSDTSGGLLPVSSPKSLSRSSSQNATAPSNEPVAHAVNDTLTNNLASILQRRTSTMSAKIAAEPTKRKHRPLGRNLSANSTWPGSGSASPAVQVELPESVSLADGFYISEKEPTQLPPSTQLGYDDPDAHAHRVQMSKKIGTNLVEDGPRLAALATIKDSAEIMARSAQNGAGASRAKARNRGKT